MTTELAYARTTTKRTPPIKFAWGILDNLAKNIKIAMRIPFVEPPKPVHAKGIWCPTYCVVKLCSGHNVALIPVPHNVAEIVASYAGLLMARLRANVVIPRNKST